MKFGFTAILLLVIFNVHGNDVKKNIGFKLHKVLDFIDQRYQEFNFDGLFGVIFAQAFLEKSLNFPLEKNTEAGIITFIEKCRIIHRKILPLLPNSPEYMITFRNKLLDANKWSKLLPDRFSLNKIKHLGYYGNWTAETIIQNKVAVYKGVKTDICLREILELSIPNEQCYFSSVCQEMMLDDTRMDWGYLLTHRLLYLQIVKTVGCKLPEEFFSIPEYTQLYCSYIFEEATTSDLLGFPHQDIFLEQVVLCGMEGYAEFLNDKWLSKIIEWQTPNGCYQSSSQYRTIRTSSVIDFGCSDHTTGLGAAALALYVRFTLWPIVDTY